MIATIPFDDVNVHGMVHGHYVAHRALLIHGATLSMPVAGHFTLLYLHGDDFETVDFAGLHLPVGEPLRFDKPLPMSAGSLMSIAVIPSITGPVGTRWQRLKAALSAAPIAVPAALILKTEAACSS